jgi:Na+-translocating membrane potential-generating system (MpsC)
MCVLRDVLLPAELKLVEMGERQCGRESRVAFQAATASEFIEHVEEITSCKVIRFASGIDPDANVVFECFYFEPLQSGGDCSGTLAAEDAGELGQNS